MSTAYLLTERYYRNIISSFKLCSDVQNLIFEYVMGMCIHQIRKKYLHFFRNHIMIYQRVSIEPDYVSHSYCFVPRKYMTFIFEHVNSRLISYPLTSTVLNCTYRHLQYTWAEMCDFIYENDETIHAMFISNWKVQIEDQHFCGLPILYYSTDIIKQKVYDQITSLTNKCYNEFFIGFD